MAWRPYENLIDGELDNRNPGKVTGWMRFFRRGKSPLRVTFDLAGDFREDIRGKVMRLKNPEPSERDPDARRSYVEGFNPLQRGAVGDITAGIPLGPWTEGLARNLMAQHEVIWDEIGITGREREERWQQFAERCRQHIAAGDLYYPYVAYPYVEWFSDANGRVVLELKPAQVEVFDIQGVVSRKGKSPKELVEGEKKRRAAMMEFLTGMAKEFSKENRKKGGARNVRGILLS